MKLAHWLIIIGSLLMLLGGLLHGVGYFSLMPKLAAGNLASNVLNLIKSLWWVFSVVGIVLCPVMIWASRLPNGRGLVLLCAVIPTAITILMFVYIGAFIGSISLAVASALLVAGGILLPGSS